MTTTIVLLGAPGSGKGTQGLRLAEALGVEHIAAGDVLRAHVYGETKLGLQVAGLLREGELVPDKLITDALTPTLTNAVAQGGYILDGFPRTVAQAHRLDRLGQRLGIAPRCIVNLDVGQAELQRRLLARAGEQGRSDDTPEVIARRLEVFRSTTAPVIDVYRDRGVLIEVDGAQAPDEITQTILAALSHVPAR
jgi:adenylate kinase